MGEVRVAVKLTNAVDEALVRWGMMTPEQIRTYEADALVDTGAVRMVVPPEVAIRLGLGVRGQRMAESADGRTETVSGTEPLVVEIDGSDTREQPLILGDEAPSGQTALEKLDLLVHSRRRPPGSNPAHPAQRV